MALHQPSFKNTHEDQDVKQLGLKVRQERKGLGLSLEAFSRLIDTSPSMLQRIETGSRSPTVDQLIEIANICRKPIYEFLEQGTQSFQKIERSARKTLRSKNASVTIICPYGVISKDLVVSYFKGKADSEVKLPSHNGYCYVYILKGSCSFEHDGRTYTLKEGDAFHYDDAKPQQLRIFSELESIRITVRT